LVVFQGLVFSNEPPTGLSARMMLGNYTFLQDEYTVYLATRKAGLPGGYSMKDMADDYAVMIEDEFGGPVDVLGISTGGSIAQHFAADHAGLVRRLVIHASAYTLNDAAKEVQMRVGRLATQGRWREASKVLMDFALAPNPFSGIIAAIASLMLAATAPDDASDLVVTIEAEDKHDFRDRLGEIGTPTLVIAGARDPFYTEESLRETADGIPNAQLVLYPDKGHAPGGEQFRRDVLTFLSAE
jgi:pimeloyl-ACP methyl ester carboxylesterase